MIKQFFKAVINKFGCDECHNKELLMAVLESNKQQIERLNNIMSALTNLQDALNRLTTATDTAVTVLNTPKEKQIGVSYNISIGGGTQGLHDNLTFSGGCPETIGS